MPANGTNADPLTTNDPAPRRLSTFRALRHRNYRLYFAGQLVSLTGSWVQITALMWLAFHLTHESRWPALVAALQIFPTCLLGVLGGSLAERWPRRSVILRTQTLLMLNAFLLSGLVWSGFVQPWMLLIPATIGGLINAVDLPARLTFIFDMVGREDLLNAIALNSLTFNLARALGPAVGALLLAVLGPGPCFFLNGLSYLAVIVALSRMQVAAAVSLPAADSHTESIWAVFRFVAGKPTLALLLVLLAVMAFCGWPTLPLLPAIATHHLEGASVLVGSDRMAYGLLLSGVGCGALLAALTVATYGSPANRRLFIGVGMLLTMGALVLLSLVRGLLPAVSCCVLIGFGLIIFMTTSQGVVQLAAGDHNRGRVMGLWSMVLSGAQPLGNLLVGPAADRLGVVPTLRLQALGMAIGGLFVLLALLVLRVRRPSAGSTPEASGAAPKR